MYPELAQVWVINSSAADKHRVPRTIPEEGGPIPLHRDTTRTNTKKNQITWIHRR